MCLNQKRTGIRKVKKEEKENKNKWIKRENQLSKTVILYKQLFKQRGMIPQIKS